MELDPFVSPRDKLKIFLEITRAVMRFDSVSKPENSDKFCKYFPEWSDWFVFMQSQLLSLAKTVDQLWLPVGKMASYDKEFARLLQGIPKKYQNFIFLLRKFKLENMYELVRDQKIQEDHRVTILFTDMLWKHWDPKNPQSKQEFSAGRA